MGSKFIDREATIIHGIKMSAIRGVAFRTGSNDRSMYSQCINFTIIQRKFTSLCSSLVYISRDPSFF